MLKANKTMTKTIAEAAREYSIDTNVTSENFCPEDIADAFENGANYIMSLPLASRMTEAEKEMIKRTYKALKRLYMEHNGSVFRWSEVYKARYEMLESIFGMELFEEE